MVVLESLSRFHVDDHVCTVATSGKKASSDVVIGLVVMCAPALCNTGINADFVVGWETSEVPGVWVSDGDGGDTVASGDSTIN